MFNEIKLTQMAGSFLRLAGGRLPYLLLMKMLYVADKRMLLQHGVPMSHDDWYSMEFGPVLSKTLDLMRERTQGQYWSPHMKTIGNDLKMTKDPGDDELSVAEDRMIAETFAEWGHIAPFEAAKRTHDPIEFPEWTDPGKGRIPIGYHEVLRLHGVKSSDIAVTMENMTSHSELMQLAAVREFG